MPTPIDNVTGIGPATATLLKHHDIHSAEDLAALRPGDLAAIKGFNSIRAGQVIDAAKQLTAAAMSDSPILAVEPDKKDKVKKEKKDKKKKKSKDLKKKLEKGEKKKSSKAKKESSSEKGKGKGKGKNKAEGSKKKGAKKK
jgi:hypothetical protein